MEDKKEASAPDRALVDRNLGDEWAGWAGGLAEYEKEINEGKRLFLGVYFIALFILTAFAMVVYYMISPRLYSFNPYIDQIVLWFVVTISGAVFIWSFLMLLTLVFNRNLLFFRRNSGLRIEWIYPVVYKIASMFKISKDRVGNSIVKVNNSIVYATRKNFKAKNLLVLLPRCLDRETRVRVTEITQKYGCTAFTATGGSSARNMVKKLRPDAVIGVACERDLVSGMGDSPKTLTVIGIPNKRPCGPCKDTTINPEVFEEAIRFLLKI